MARLDISTRFSFTRLNLGGEGKVPTVPPWNAWGVSWTARSRASVVRLMPGVEDVAHTVTDEIHRQNRDKNGEPRKPHCPPIVNETGARHGGHQSPFGGRRLSPYADEAQRSGRENGIAEIHGALDDDGRGGIWQCMAQHDPRAPNSHGAGGRDVKLALHPHDGGRTDPRIPGKQGNGQGDNGVEQAGAQRRRDGDREQQRREGQEYIRYAHQYGVDTSAEKTGDQADGHADPDSERD